MADLQQFPAKICYTAAAFLIVKKKILLIKHKKLGIWLAPGGHAEPGELLHVTAERECFEESGVRVKAYDRFFKPSLSIYDSIRAEYLPSPLLTNLHWVSQQNYQTRVNNPKTYTPIAPWLKGCEQHLGFTYLVEPIGSTATTQNQKETDGIGWFSPSEVAHIETTDDIRFEVQHAFAVNFHLV